MAGSQTQQQIHFQRTPEAVGTTNLLQLCDGIMSIWTQITVAQTQQGSGNLPQKLKPIEKPKAGQPGTIWVLHNTREINKINKKKTKMHSQILEKCQYSVGGLLKSDWVFVVTTSFLIPDSIVHSVYDYNCY